MAIHRSNRQRFGSISTKVLEMTYIGHVTNDDVIHLANMLGLQAITAGLTGHLLRVSDDKHAESQNGPQLIESEKEEDH